MYHVARVGVRICQRELVNVVFAVERESEAQHVVILVLRGSIIKYLQYREERINAFNVNSTSMQLMKIYELIKRIVYIK